MNVGLTTQILAANEAAVALAADCLAEGRKWIDKNAAAADASRKQDPVLFRNGAWSFERKYTVGSVVDGRYVSVVRSDYMDTGGAHPNSDVDTILWDDAAKKRISIFATARTPFRRANRCVGKSGKG